MASIGLGELVWRINGDTSRLDKSLDKSEKKLSGFGSKLNKIGSMLMTGAIATGILSIGKRFIMAGSDAEETNQKFGVVFSSISDQANSMANALASSYNVSRNEAKKMLSDTGDLLTGFGFTQEAALSLSTDVLKLGSDLASFTNYAGGAEGATEVLTKALLGEREALKGLGISITEEQLKKFAEETHGVTGELSQQQKALYTLQIAQKQSKNAIGDVSRSAGSFASELRKAQSHLNNFIDSLGGGLASAAAVALSGLNKVMDGFVLLSESMKTGQEAIDAFGAKDKEVQEDIISSREKTTNALKDRIEKQEAALDRYIKSVTKNGRIEIDQLNSLQKANLERRRSTIEGLKGQMNSQEQYTQKLKDNAAAFEKLQADAKKSADTAGSAASDSEKKARTWAEAVQELQKEYEELNDLQKFQAQVAYASTAVSMVTSVISTMDSLQQVAHDKEMERIDQREQRALEAAGVAERTRRQDLQDSIDAAKKKGDYETAQELEKELRREEIQAKFDRERKMAEYRSAVQSWEYKRLEMIANNAMALTNIAAHHAWNPPIMAALFGIQAGLAGVQLAAHAAAKPSVPKFADGGVVPGTSFSGDNVPIMANSGEVVTTQEDFAEIRDMIRSGANAGQVISVPIYIGGKMIAEEFYRLTKNRVIKIHKDAITSR